MSRKHAVMATKSPDRERRGLRVWWCNRTLGHNSLSGHVSTGEGKSGNVRLSRSDDRRRRGTARLTPREAVSETREPLAREKLLRRFQSRPPRRAYPRWRGGNAIVAIFATPVWGLSPLARGKLLTGVWSGSLSGPIPAGAGETSAAAERPHRPRAYPRWRGGNILRRWNCVGSGGLSPLARGKHVCPTSGFLSGGPIPAGAGETRAIAAVVRAAGAYPRWRGGNFRRSLDAAAGPGLSPLARGKRRSSRRWRSSIWPIPAGAGETRARLWARVIIRAYPRWRGGNLWSRAPCCEASGLSPLARGKRRSPGSRCR